MLLQAEVGAESLAVVVINDLATVTGGGDTVALAEAEGLARKGHRVTLLAGSGEPDPDLVKAGVAVRRTGQHTTLSDPSRLRGAARGIWNRASAAAVRELAVEADLIHIHCFTKVISPSAIRAAVDSGVPTVVTLHDYFAACPNGGFFNYQSQQICRLTPLSARCLATNCDIRAYSHKLWRVGRFAVQRWLGEMPAGIRHLIVPSDFALGVLRPFLPSTARVHVLANPIPEPRMPRAGVAASDAFVFVGRLRTEKGPLLFARAAHAAGARAVFVGDGEDAAAVRQANPDAELRGWLDPAGVRATVRSARAAVVPSQWYEVQPLSPLEAAAHGVPAVVADTSAAREAVDDRVTGLWFRGGDTDDLAAKLVELRRAPELADRLGSAAYERFWSGGWDTAAHVDRLERVYRTAIRS